MGDWQEMGEDWGAEQSQKPDYNNQRQKRPNPSGAGDHSSKKLNIPTNKIGRIIGKGGNMIQNIQKETRTKIDIVRGQSETSEASISGSPNDVQKAEDMIMRLTTEEFNRERRNDFDRKPREDWGGERKQRDDWGGERKPRDDWGGERKPRDDWGGDRKPRDDFGERKPRNDWGGDRKPRDDWGGDRKPRDDFGGGERKPRNDYKPRDDFGGGERKPRNDWGGDRKPRDDWGGDRKPRNDYDRKPRDDDRKSRNDWGGDRKPREDFGDRKPKDDWNNLQSSDWGGNDKPERNNSWSQSKPRDDWNNKQERNNDDSWNKPETNNWSSDKTTTFESTQSTTKRDYPEIDFQKLNAECAAKAAEYWANKPSIKKNFYKELPEISSMSEDEVAELRDSLNQMVVERPLSTDDVKAIPNPITKFSQAFHNFPDILGLIDSVGFTEPTPIQCQSWPVLLSGEDMIGIAQTGTGKTLAFLLPALIHMHNQETPRDENSTPSALVFAPTRELALQIKREVDKYNYKGTKSVCVYGGASRQDQIEVLTRGVDIIIATPGRLDDLVLAGHIDVTGITYVVLDEADRMLDMGFEPQIRKTMFKLNPGRQVVMTSATWPPGVRRLATSYMKDPVQVYIGSLDLEAVKSVTQSILILRTDGNAKFDYFMNFMKNVDKDDKIIVFTSKKATAADLCAELHLAGITCASIHGDMDQSDREGSLADMMSGRENVLIATDVASRGIDIQDISLVLNYDFPRNIEEYVHRVGRTGRAGRTGQSITYFTRSDSRHASELIKILEKANQEVPNELIKIQERHVIYASNRENTRGRGGFRGGGGGGFNNRY